MGRPKAGNSYSHKKLFFEMKKMFFIAVAVSMSCLAVLFSVPVMAQPNIQQQKSIGGSDKDQAFDFVLNSDGSVIIGGQSASGDGDVSNNKGGNDGWVVKLSPEMIIEWEKNYGGTSNEGFMAVIPYGDNYLAIGPTASTDGQVNGNHGGRDVWLVVFNDLNGGIVSKKCFGGSGDDVAYSVLLNGTYIVIAGATTSTDGDVNAPSYGSQDGWIFVLDENLEIIWSKTYGGEDDDCFTKIMVSNEDPTKYTAVGKTKSSSGNIEEWSYNNGGYDGLSVDVSTSNGEISILSCWGGTANESFNAIVQVNSKYQLGGTGHSPDGYGGNLGEGDFLTTQTDNQGSLWWQYSNGGTMNDSLTTMSQAGGDSNDFIAAGLTWSNDIEVSNNHGGSDAWIIRKTSEESSSNLLWKKTFGGPGNDGITAISPIPWEYGAFIAVGHSGEVGGDIPENKGESDIWIMKLVDGFGTNDEIVTANNGSGTVSVYPNPMISCTKVQFSGILPTHFVLMDMTGKAVATGFIEEGSLTLSKNDLSPGTYLLESFMADGEMCTAKIMVQ